jgi:4-oxalomesaconate tautomerase
VHCTLVDNGMPCIVFKAEDVGATGYETREELDSDAFADLRARIETIRLAAGPLMKLGDVKEKSVPKMMLVAPPKDGGAVCVRSFIPHRAHATNRRAGRGDGGDRVPSRWLAGGRSRDDSAG